MKRSVKVMIVVGVGLFGAALLALAVRPGESRWWTDGDGIRVDSESAPIREVLWRPASPLKGDGLASADEYEPRYSADGTVVVFVRNRPSQNADLYTSRWSPAGWSKPEPVASINSPKDELGPELSRDGALLYFYSDRAGGLGGYDLWVSTNKDGEWGTPTNLGPAVNTRHNEYGPALSPDGSRLYFSSNRPREGEPATTGEAWTATMREHRTRHDYDLYCAHLAAEREAEPLDALNTSADEGAPALSPVGDFLYFASDRGGGLGGFDLYRTWLARLGREGAIENLGSSINSASNDLDPALSSDGFRLTFSCDRPLGAEEAAGAAGGPDAEGRYTLWTSVSREVYRDVEQRESRLLAALKRLWPWVLLLPLALVPFYLLYRMLRDASWRARFERLSLLAQCLLLSLLIHTGIASAFTVWKVGSGVVDLMRKDVGGGTRVILSSGAAVGTLASQVRGGTTEVSSPVTVLEPLMVTAAPEVSPLEAVMREAALPELVAAPSPVPRVAAGDLGREATVTTRRDTVVPVSGASIDAEVPTAGAPREQRAEAGAPAPVLPEGDARPRVSSAGGSQMVEVGLAPLPLAAQTSPVGGVAIPLESGGTTAIGTLPPMATGVPKRSAASDAMPGVPTARAAGAKVEEAAAGNAASIELPASGGPARPMIAGLPEAAPVEVPLPRVASTGDTRGSAPLRVIESDVVSRSPSVMLLSPKGAVPGSKEALAASAAGAGLPSVQPAARRGAEEVARAGVAVDLPMSTTAAPVGVPGSEVPINSVVIDQPALPSTLGSGWSGSRLDLPPAVATREPGSTASAPIRTSTALPHRRDADIPVGIPVPLETFAQRAPESRSELVEKMGGSAETERAVGLALEWFQRHQSRDGHWSAQHFDDGCGACNGGAEFKADTAMTGLVLLCYLGAGHTHQHESPYRESVGRGIKWLVDRQSPDGDLRQGETMYGQTVAAVALCEAFAMTRDPALAAPAQRAVDFVLARANKSGRADDRDTSVIGWLVFTVESARRAGFEVPQATFESARSWLAQVVDPGAPGRYAYTKGGATSPAMTAEAMFVQQLLGRTRTEPLMEQSAGYILATPPRWGEGAPTYYWYYATLALFQHQGDAWKQWNERLVAELLKNQQQDGASKGSWAPTDEWSRMGGRVYQTAVCTLSLEVYYRYKAR